MESMDAADAVVELPSRISYEKLLAKFDDIPAFFDVGYALRSVIIRHKPETDMNGYSACKECSRIAYYNVPFPCQTMTDIMKEY